MSTSIAVVVIGRNEGERLKRCLASVQAQVARIVYVDSGSSDDSVAHARSLGIEVVELDTSVPFTAARGRNAGFMALHSSGQMPDFVQFIDGDCLLAPNWISAALAHVSDRPELGIVTGWRSEIDRNRSVYNAMCDFEWHRPAGPIEACGGDMMVRAPAFHALKGFNPQVIAAEDDEFCARLRKSGLRIERLPLSMTRHDAAMTRFSEWWRRSVRSGHGFGQVGDLHPDHFRPERRRVWLYGLILPLVFLTGLTLTLLGKVLAGTVLMVAVLAGYKLSWLRTVQGLVRSGLPLREAMHHGLYLSLSKFPNLIGMLTYLARRWQRRDMNIIEYK
ncbi:glycosyltransferase family 2 protein [Hydrogenophaga sp. IBVHS1]|uniref:glycosyltransferase n=1 Tax=unclassified Hydrogenophaga TaxID=2610897 RepID=UPI000A2D84E6|nr:glycosyltransferase [Hydrogenophaga sp. IBVHS1]OSZ75426.1 glycosyl transferase [Hydrogenophaga sp. IBVHS1]